MNNQNTNTTSNLNNENNNNYEMPQFSNDMNSTLDKMRNNF